MHYKNGRPAQNGDKVVVIPSYGAPYAGILYDAQAGNDFCNGRIAITSPSDPQPNLKEVLRYDDVAPLPYIEPVKAEQSILEQIGNQEPKNQEPKE